MSDNDDENLRLVEQFIAKGGKIGRKDPPRPKNAGPKVQQRDKVTARVQDVTLLTYTNGKYAGHHVLVIDDEGAKPLNFIASRDIGTRLILGRRYVFTVNFNVAHHPVGKDGVYIDASIKTVPYLAARPHP